ncbi:MAG: SDR family oxidoreductase [Actinomycetota bacterium]
MSTPEDPCSCLAEAFAPLVDGQGDVTISMIGDADALAVDTVSGLVEAAVDGGCRRLVLVVPTPLPAHAGGGLGDALAAGAAGAAARNAAVRLAPAGTANVLLVGPLDLDERCGPGCFGVDPQHRSTVEQEAITGRLSTVEQVAGTLGFLLSDGADYLNGIVVPVDGGLSAGRHA